MPNEKPQEEPFNIKWVGSPTSNFLKGRPRNYKPEAIVIHLMDGSFTSGEATFENKNTHKSAHYGISKSGEVHQFVEETDTAFHAGVVVNPTWPRLKPGINPNFYTIGIEHEGRPEDVWEDRQIEASAQLIGDIARRWAIPLDCGSVIRHHEIRASKCCPGNWLTTTEMLLSRVRELALPSDKEVAAGFRSVTLLKNANLRSGEPSTTAALTRLLPAQSTYYVTGIVKGECVGGNPLWFADGRGNYLWSGATDTNLPCRM